MSLQKANRISIAKKDLTTNLRDVQNVVRLASKPDRVDFTETETAKCSRLHAQNAARKQWYLSDLLAISRSIVEIVTEIEEADPISEIPSCNPENRLTAVFLLHKIFHFMQGFSIHASIDTSRRVTYT